MNRRTLLKSIAAAVVVVVAAAAAPSMELLSDVKSVVPEGPDGYVLRMLGGRPIWCPVEWTETQYIRIESHANKTPSYTPIY